MEEENDCSDFSCTPPEIASAAKVATLNLLPEKSRGKYENQYELFITWCNSRKVRRYTENVMMAYFSEKAKTMNSATLWSVYSMLRSVLTVRNNIDISQYTKLIAYLKRQSVGYKLKKSRTFTKEELFKFLYEAPDEIFLMKKVAIKILDVTQIKEDYIIRNLHREARIMSQLRHPCIAGLFQTMQNDNLYYLVTELVGGGDLCTFIKTQKYGKLDERNTKIYARQLISALAHMHNLGIVHRDLKMENVMMNSIHTQIKIVDFGLSNIYDPSCPLRTHCGSPEYAAPELFVPGKSYGPEVDLWSLGVILYGMVVGQLPFVTIREENLSSQERRKKLLLQINKGYSSSQRKALSLASPDFRAMAARMLIADAAKRITVNELMFHNWVTEKGKRGVIMNPWKSVDEDLQMSIMKQVGVLLQLDWTTVRYAINSEPQGDIAGMYNIYCYRLRSQQLDGDGVTKTILPSQISHYVTPRTQTVIEKKDSSVLSASNLKIKKRVEQIKSPVVHKVQKTSPETTPPVVPGKRLITASEKRPQTATNAVRTRKTKETTRIVSAQQKPKQKQALVSPDVRNRSHSSAENKRVDFQWNFNEPQTIPPPAEGQHKTISVLPATNPKPRGANVVLRSAEKPRVQQPVPKPISPSSSNSKGLKNEVHVVGSKGLAKVLSAKKKPTPERTAKDSATIHSAKSNRTTEATVQYDKIKSKSDPAAYNRRVPSASPAGAASRLLRNLKRSRVLPVTGTVSAPKTMAASAPPPSQMRNRRMTMSKPPPNIVEQSLRVLGDTHKRRASTTTTPGKHMQIQRTILTDPIARSIAGYIANNIPTKLDGLHWTKHFTKQ